MTRFLEEAGRWAVCLILLAVPFLLGLGMTLWLGFAWTVLIGIVLVLLIGRMSSPSGMDGAFAFFYLLVAFIAGIACGAIWHLGSFALRCLQ